MTWAMIVAMLIEVLLPVLKDLLDRWLRPALEAAAKELDGRPYWAPTVVTSKIDFDQLMDCCLEQLPWWNPLNWKRRWQVQTLRRLLKSKASEVWMATLDKSRGRPFTVPPLTEEQRRELKSLG